MEKHTPDYPGYKLIPMSEITDEARKIAVAWCDGFESDLGIQIEQRHKLASDIMHYAKVENDRLQSEVARLKEENEGLKTKIADGIEPFEIQWEQMRDIAESNKIRFQEAKAELSALRASHEELYTICQDLRNGRIGYSNQAVSKRNEALSRASALREGEFIG